MAVPTRGPAAVALAAGAALLAVALAALWLVEPDNGVHGTGPLELGHAGDRADPALRSPVAPRPAHAGDRLQPAARQPVGTDEAPAADARSPGAARLRVLVLGTDQQPLEEASVRVLLVQGSRARELATLSTDAEGTCAVDLPEVEDLHPFELATHTLIARARASGHQPHEGRMRADMAFDARKVLRLVLRPGAWIEGRVLGADGAPIAAARVTVLAPAGGEEGGRELLARTASRANGTFLAGLPPITGPVRVAASHPSEGHAEVRTSVAGGGAVAPDLVLTPVGLLEGSVHFPDGRAARGAQVSATPLELDRIERPAAVAFATSGATVEADERGRFRFALLDPGLYRLDVGNPYSVRRRALESTPRSFRTPASGLRLEAPHVALHVRVEDPEGRPLAGVGVDGRRVDSEGRPGQAPAWVDEPLRLVDRVWVTTIGDPPVAVLGMDPGDRVVLRVELPACHPSQALVAARADPGEQEVVLVVQPRSSAGHVAVRVTAAGGAPVGAFAVDVFDPFTRLQVRSDLRPDEDGRLPALAPGRWLLRARSPEAPPPAGGPLPAGVGLAVEVVPDASVHVDLRLDWGD